ncbi:hypothetical protein LQ938_05855 [Microbacterium sp. cx-55]|nr:MULTISPECIES: hypothetical protein [unclassified Microbacterium]MBZ4486736.1 hypothetical protein [Microbacterium sp. cx-55]MCC4907713.1 hypothetical protein [Microbacterium sp. cx-59]UGB36307.1 hypothetical protein LQ938_05855 [Microbacterium sp. cx-55]
METTILLCTLALAATGIVAATLAAIRGDGYGQRPESFDYDTRNPH